MPVQAATPNQLATIRRKLSLSKCGIVDVREDMSYEDAVTLIGQLIQEERDVALANAVPKELNLNQMPQPAQMRFLWSLMDCKVGSVATLQEFKHDYAIPDGQHLTSTETEKLIYRLMRTQTNTDKMRDYEEAFQRWTSRI